jgi:hypothetical protein
MLSMTNALAVLLALVVAFAADRPTPEDPEALLQQIRSRTAAHLAQLPNYTCHEVIDRLLRRGSSWNRLDTVEVEVAFLGQQELFARPGEERFEERRIDRVVPHGTIGNGAFGAHIGAVFSQDVADFKYAGTGKKDGHRTVRYDFSVPLEKSRFLVRHAANEAIVPYEGSVWVDADTLDLVRVDLRVKHIPSHIGVRGIEESMHYKVMRIGGAEFLLPRKSELGATDDTGAYSLNLVQLQSCREFKADSIVKYGAPSEGSAARESPQH